jgi:ADP-ribose pyrophosphatase YjhB (NUDIX family)
MAKAPPPDPPTANLPFSRKIPDGDTKPREVCDTCGFIAYVNPKIVVGSVISAGEKLLLCRRAIEPRKGFWTIPAGFLEEGEGLEEGARREAREEAEAEIAIDALLAVYSVPRISQVQIFYRAALLGSFAPGPESLEAAPFSLEEIPRAELAFPSVHWVLDAYRETRGHTGFSPFGNP